MHYITKTIYLAIKHSPKLRSVIVILTQESGVEVEVGVSLEALIISEKECDEDARDNNVTQTKHGKVGGSKTIHKQVLN